MPADDVRALVRYALAGLVVTVAIAWGLYLARNALLLIYIASLIAIGLAPIVRAIQQERTRQRVPRWVAILAVYLAFLGVLAGIGSLVVPPLVEQARQLWAELPQLAQRVQQWLIDLGLLSRALSVREAVQQSPVAGADAVTTVFNAIWGFVGGIFGVVTILILAFYLLVDADAIVRTFLRLFPPARRPRVQDACKRVAVKVSAWLAGQLLLAGIIGTTAALGLWLMGVPYFYVLALVAAVGEMIPIVGPLLAAIPAVIVGFTVSPALGIGVAAFYIVQQQFENHVLVPKVMERQVGVSAVGVIVALLVGGSVLGIVGAILAVPTAAILQVLFEELVPERPAE
jgi:predicted PurR-regulated permease PerM